MNQCQNYLANLEMGKNLPSPPIMPPIFTKISSSPEVDSADKKCIEGLIERTKQSHIQSLLERGVKFKSISCSVTYQVKSGFIHCNGSNNSGNLQGVEKGFSYSNCRRAQQMVDCLNKMQKALDERQKETFLARGTKPEDIVCSFGIGYNVPTDIWMKPIEYPTEGRCYDLSMPTPIMNAQMGYMSPEFSIDGGNKQQESLNECQQRLAALTTPGPADNENSEIVSSSGQR